MLDEVALGRLVALGLWIGIDGRRRLRDSCPGTVGNGGAPDRLREGARGSPAIVRPELEPGCGVVATAQLDLVETFDAKLQSKDERILDVTAPSSVLPVIPKRDRRMQMPERGVIAKG